MTQISDKIIAGGSGAARETILESIRKSLVASEPFDIRHTGHNGAQPAPKLDSAKQPPLTSSELIDNFRSNLESVGGHCTIVENESEAAKSVRELIERSGSKRVAISNSSLIGRVVRSVEGVEIIKSAEAQVLFECDIGITGAQWAIAETGTLVLQSDAEDHRLTSLVPPVHLCILTADSIRQTLGEILELTRSGPSRTITFITGASRTSDIELTLAIGVHGPAELHVIILTN